MNNLLYKFQESLAIYEHGLFQCRIGKKEEGERLLANSFRLATEAAEEVISNSAIGYNTFYEILRSAILISLELDNRKRAIELIGHLLTRATSTSHIQYLQDLLNRSTLSHVNVNTKGELDEKSLILSIDNTEKIGTDTEAITERFTAINKMIVYTKNYKTGKTFSNKSYRRIPMVCRSIPGNYEKFILSMPSFNDLFTQLPNSDAEKLLQFVTINLELAANQDIEALKSRIIDVNYLQNFIANAATLAPDGIKIKQLSINGPNESFADLSSRNEIGNLVEKTMPPLKSGEDILIYDGHFEGASTIQKKMVLIVKDTKEKINIEVSEGLKDIVTMHFAEQIRVKVKKNIKSNSVVLISTPERMDDNQKNDEQLL